ncbi:GNAT family N-acetyltransferase [Aliarcobacter butzleri]|uniref:GNAT family N-acetyltransferase n=1 Tax=Aliarcobacter butzleri TaxID=28197 RepID=UPI0021B4520F|nr:GNAT family N-acetyltransferase [Aliarcobacter butzleri]MCT7557141.1 GNAT family N-acetyltransferase [Aliarcobacter butzleri]MCT7622141.1 GNAT family N-acetyltransferase [Aliarcobacter butzleri]MCT7633544.1 GNAT family N-acetyltransferase [Aliarcobacter butzleri]
MNIIGKNIQLRTVEVVDAEFIFEMRQNQDKTKYLSKVTGTVESQKEWIKSYKQRENEKKEFYFVIELKDSEKLGLVRMYDFQNESFCWGSWLIKENAPKTTAIESALQIYEFAFYKLNFSKSHFEVQKGNDKVIAFHQRFGAKIVDENEKEIFFNFEKSDYEIIKEKYKRYL